MAPFFAGGRDKLFAVVPCAGFDAPRGPEFRAWIREIAVNRVGIDVWGGGLHWLDPAERMDFDISNDAGTVAWLLSTYRSQIEGGKSYDQALISGWAANATFYHWDEVDE